VDKSTHTDSCAVSRELFGGAVCTCPPAERIALLVKENERLRLKLAATIVRVRLAIEE